MPTLETRRNTNKWVSDATQKFEKNEQTKPQTTRCKKKQQKLIKPKQT